MRVAWFILAAFATLIVALDLRTSIIPAVGGPIPGGGGFYLLDHWSGRVAYCANLRCTPVFPPPAGWVSLPKPE